MSTITTRSAAVFVNCSRPSLIIRSSAKRRTAGRAWSSRAKTRPDIAILDYSIPELNGLDLSHALKREFPRIEILLYTMHDREEIIMDVLRAGVRGFVLKSDAERHLLAALDALSIHRPYFSGRDLRHASRPVPRKQAACDGKQPDAP